MKRAALPLVVLALLAAACTDDAPAPPRQVAAATPFAPQGLARADFDLDAARGVRPPAVAVTSTGVTTATPQRALPVPRRVRTTGPCPDPQLVLSTILEQRTGGTAWTFLITGECALSRLELNIRLAVDRGTDPRCFVQDAMRHEKVPLSEWSDMPCTQIGYLPNNDLIEGWHYEPIRIAPGTSESRVTIVHRSTASTPPGLPAPIGVLFTWSWDGGPINSMRWDALPIIGRSVEPRGETITRGLPLPGG